MLSSSGAVAGIVPSSYTTKPYGGQGLVSCKRIVDDLRGKVEVESTVGVGTVFRIELPTVPQPAWFIRSINLTDHEVFVFIDDDEDMESRWVLRMQDRIKDLDMTIDGQKVVIEYHFLSQPGELRSNYSNLLRAATRFFVDFELKGYPINGLSLIKEHGIQSKAILVTDHFHESSILQQAVDTGVPVLPKEFIDELNFNVDIGGAIGSQTAVPHR